MRTKFKPALVIGLGFISENKFIYSNTGMKKQISHTIILPFLIIKIKKN